MTVGSLPPLVEPGAELSASELVRYSRHLTLPDVGALGQRRLKNARVLVVGAGGLGSPALLYLAAAGVGTLGIVDPDVVDASNLQRQVIHGQADLGRLKVDSAADRIGQVNPNVRVDTHAVRLTASNALELLAGYDLVLDGTDNFATRYLVGDACEMLAIPEVWGSIFRFDGQVSVFWPRRGPLYRDLFPTPPPAGSVPSCAEGGVLGVLCACIGSVMATEAVKVLCGIGEPLVGRLMVFDALQMSWRTVRVRPDPTREPVTALIDDDAFCGVPPAELAPAAAREIDVLALRDLLAARSRGDVDFVLIDVREPFEREVVSIPGSISVPHADILDGSALAGWAPDRKIILYCQSGGRSASALAALHEAGRRDAVQVSGGVLAWVAQLDPDQPPS